jgi:hypothetical protein
VHLHPGEYVLEDVLRSYNVRANCANVDGTSGGGRGEDCFLPNVELSFLLLLHLECHGSLEYWKDTMLALLAGNNSHRRNEDSGSCGLGNNESAIDKGGVMV